jgi:poly-beta-1,6-N-acetyl-D-glucosamine N-deacetylase
MSRTGPRADVVSAGRGEPGQFGLAAEALADEARRSRPLLLTGRLAVRLVLAVIALAVLASPFAVTFYLHYRAEWIGPQFDTPLARLSAQDISQFHQAAVSARHALRADPIILAYHDIAWNSTSQYVVTPAAFEAQMAMLKAAGYHTLTAGQLVHYLRGGSVPSPSVAITFDDGTRGLWTYADKILARYHFHGISFVITGRVGTHRPYYLTWQEIRIMHSSGRWDFESHTDNLHQKVPISASGRLDDPLTNLIWLPSQHRRETMPEFIARVRDDINDSISELTENQLPRPQLFAYPFSESFGAPPQTASGYANRLVQQMFAAAMTNYIEPPAPLSRREAAAGLVSRMELTREDTAGTLFSQLQAIASVPVASPAVVTDRTRWLAEDGNTAHLGIAGRNITFKGRHATWAYAAYAPGGTADWDGYSITTKIADLTLPANPNATISVRLGSRSQLNVSVANHYVEVKLGSVRTSRVARGKALSASAAHRLTVRVQPRLTVVSIDGQVIWKKPVIPGPSSTGGFALSAFRHDPHSQFPRFGAFTLRRLAS